MGDYDEHPEDLAKETDCGGEIILTLRGRESANPDKTFSTFSDKSRTTRCDPSCVESVGRRRRARLR